MRNSELYFLTHLAVRDPPDLSSVGVRSVPPTLLIQLFRMHEGRNTAPLDPIHRPRSCFSREPSGGLTVTASSISHRA